MKIFNREKISGGKDVPQFKVSQKKKKKTLIIVIGILGVLFLMVGVFCLGRIFAENKPSGFKKRSEKSNNSKSEGKFSYTSDEVYSGYFAFSNLDFLSSEYRVIIVSKNHPKFKELLSGGKLQRNKQFIIFYGMPNRIKNKVEYYFDENNQELEIKEP